jgi:uncharacterized protein
VAARLLVSLSGLSDADALARGRAFVAALAARGVPVTHLFRPAGAPAELVAWAHERLGAGDALALHGYDHAERPLGSAPVLGRRAEFAGLPRHEAGLRLVAARRALGAAGLRTDVFVPPRWRASEGTVEALTEQGFRVLADEAGLHDLVTGEVERARVLGFRATGWPGADRSTGEQWRLRLLVAEVARTARRGGLVRVAMRDKDLRRPARRDAALAAVDAALGFGARPLTYRAAPARPAA